MIQVPEFMAGNGHAIVNTGDTTRPCECIGVFAVVLSIGAVAVYVTHANILPPSCLLVNKENEVFFVGVKLLILNDLGSAAARRP